MKAPVLLLTYVKHSTLVEILNAIIKYNPPKLYVSRNLASSQELTLESKRVEEVLNSFKPKFEIEIINNISHLNINDSFHNALNNVFEKEDSIIVLEDDTIPSDAFFAYCNSCLTKYYSNNQVHSIIGYNFGINDSVYSYAFVDAGLPFWGWATWKNRWKKMQHLNSHHNKLAKLTSTEPNILSNKPYLSKAFNRHLHNYITWDIDWSIYGLVNGLKCIIPGVNLISNLGYVKIATTTTNTVSKFNNNQRFRQPYRNVYFTQKSTALEHKYYTKQELFIKEFEQR